MNLLMTLLTTSDSLNWPDAFALVGVSAAGVLGIYFITRK